MSQVSGVRDQVSGVRGQGSGASGQRSAVGGQGAPASFQLPASSPLARRLQLPGRLRKQVRVPERHIAIVPAEAGPTMLEPGEHSLPNWPAPAPEVILVDAGPQPLELRWDALPAGDGELAALTVGLEVAVADPLRLHDAWLRLSPGPEWPLPADAIAGRLHESVSQWAADYAAADLSRRPAQEALAHELRKSLAAELARYGLAAAAPALTIRCLTQASQEALAEAARRAQELALDARMAEVLAQLETRDMFLDQMAAWAERTGEPLDDAALELLWRRVAPDGLPLRQSEAVQASLAEAAGEMAATAAAQAEPLPPDRRFAQMQARMGAPADAAPERPSASLNRVYMTLRLSAATVGVVWAARNVVSNGFAGEGVAGLALEGLGLVVAAVGVGAAAVTYRQAQRRAAPYWLAVQDRIAGLPAAVRLDAVRGHARRTYLAADALMLVALVAGLLLWLNRQPPTLLALPVLAFLVAFGLVLVARGRERQARRQVDALAQRAVMPTLPERLTADDLVRRKVREYLARGQTNLEEAGSALYRLGPDGQAVSATLRRLRTGPLARLQEETQTVHYRDAAYFASVWVSAEQVTEMLDLDDDLLRRARKLALDSEALYQAAADGDSETCAAATTALDKDINQLRRVLGERSAFIEGA